VFGGVSNEWFKTIIETSDGGWVAAGATFSPASGNKTSPAYGDMDYWVVRLDRDGNKLWDQTFGGSAYDQLWGVCETSDGGFLACGNSVSGTNGNKSAPPLYPYGGNVYSDVWLIRMDASGEILWQRTYGGQGHDWAYPIQRLASGGFAVAGAFLGGSLPDVRPQYGETDAWILCLDAQGNKLWEQVFGGDTMDYAVHISQTADGGFVVGARWRSRARLHRAHLLKFAAVDGSHEPAWIDKSSRF